MVRHGLDLHPKIQTFKLARLALLSWILTSHVILTSADENQRGGMFYSVQSASLIGRVTMTRLVKNEMECAFMCFSHYPHKCLSFNFGGVNAFDKRHVCELSNSERALEPHMMQKRRGFDYFGMHKVYLSRFFPCLASPCRNGGSCTNGPALEAFFCNCPLEIRVLPYIDNKCGVDRALMETGSPVGKVFFAKVGRKQLNYFEAERLCNIVGATLASLDQLTAAYEAGLYRCEYAWLVDATVRYPMQEVRPFCGNKTGIIGTETVRDKYNGQYDAWCYKD